MLYNIHDLCWDERLLHELDIPAVMLPQVCDSSRYLRNAATCSGAQIPIAGIAGDQQAALFGQGCFRPGEAKNTYGTGCFLLMNTGAQTPSTAATVWSRPSPSGLNGQVQYALEGSGVRRRGGHPVAAR